MAEDDSRNGRGPSDPTRKKNSLSGKKSGNQDSIHTEVAELSAGFKALKKQMEDIFGYIGKETKKLNSDIAKSSNVVAKEVASSAYKSFDDMYSDLEGRHEKFLDGFLSREKKYTDKIADIWGDIKRTSPTDYPQTPSGPSGPRPPRGSNDHVTSREFGAAADRIAGKLDRIYEEMAYVGRSRDKRPVDETARPTRASARATQEDFRERLSDSSTSKMVGVLTDIKKVLVSVYEEERGLRSSSKSRDTKRSQSPRRFLGTGLGLDEDELDNEYFDPNFLEYEVGKLSGQIGHYKREVEEYYENMEDPDLSNKSRGRKQRLLDQSRVAGLDRSQLLQSLKKRKDLEDLEKQTYKDEVEKERLKSDLKKSGLSDDEIEDLNKNIQTLTDAIDENRKVIARETPSREQDRIIRQREEALRGRIRERERVITRKSEMDTFWDESRESMLKAIVGVTKKFFDTFYKLLENGFTKFSNVYESTFTNVAARVGSETRAETTKLYTDVIDRATKMMPNSSLNVNEEVLPYLDKAATTGLQGDTLLAKATSDAFAGKFMPWFDTQNDSWTQMFTYMSTETLRNIQAQQLLLRSSQAGNRLLQSGVVSNLTAKIEPVLRSIDYNTGGAENLPAEIQAAMANLVSKGYNPEEAFNAMQPFISVMNDRANAAVNGSPLEKVLATQASSFGQMIDIASDFTKMSSGLDDIGAGLVGGALGTKELVPINTESFYSMFTDAIKNGEFTAETDPDTLSTAIGKEIAQSGEKITVTDQYTNALENALTNSIGVGISQIPFGVDILSGISGTAGDILSTLLELKTMSMVKNIISRSRGERTLGGDIFGMGGAGAKGLLSKGLGKLGGGLLSTTSTGALAGLANLLGIGAGVGEAVYGGINAYHDFSNSGKISNTGNESAALKGSGVLNAAGGLAGAAGATTLALLGLSNPIGWAALAFGGLALGGSALVKQMTKESDAVIEVSKRYDEQRDLMEQESQARRDQIANLKDQIQDADTLDEKKKLLVSKGMATDQDVLNMNADQIDALLARADMLEKSKSDNASTIFSEFQKQAKEDTGSTLNGQGKQEILKLLAGAKSVDEQKSILKSIGNYTDEDLSAIGKTKFGTNHTVTAEDLVSGGYLTGFKQWNSNNYGIRDKGVTIDKINAAAINFGGATSNVLNGAIDEKLAKQLTDAYSYVSLYSDMFRSNPKSLTQSEMDAYNENMSLLLRNKSLVEKNSRIGDLEKFYRDPNRSYATGLTYAYGDANVRIHEGEGILTKSENSAYLATAQTLPIISKLFGGLFSELSDMISDVSSEESNEKIVDAINSSSQRIVEAIISASNKKLEPPRTIIPTARPQYDPNIIGLSPTM